MGDGADRRQLLGGGVALVLVALVTPFVVPEPTVFGFSPVVQASIVSLFLLLLSIILLVMLGSYTERTTDLILDSPGTVLVSGLGSVLMLVGPYVALVALTVLLDAVGVMSLVFLTVLATPLLGVMLTAIGIGLVAIGRAASEKEGVVLIVVAAVAAPIGAFPIPFALLAVAITVLGLGAIVRDIRYGSSKLESDEHESYGRQHRYF